AGREAPLGHLMPSQAALLDRLGDPGAAAGRGCGPSGIFAGTFACPRSPRYAESKGGPSPGNAEALVRARDRRRLMNKRALAAVGCVAVLGAAAWIGGAGPGARQPAGAWAEVAPGVFRSPGLPAGYALVDGDAALLIDAPAGAEGLKARGVKKV